MIRHLVFALCACARSAETSASQGLTPKIVGGKPVPIEEFPWQVVILVDGNLDCGGSIISQRYVLTAAHCLEPPAWTMDIRFGTSDWTRGYERLAMAHVAHEKYSSFTYDFDVGLVSIEGLFIYGTTVKPVKMPNQRNVLPPGTVVTVTGWGRLREGGTTSQYLQAVNVKVIDWNICARIHEPKEIEITSRMFCAGEPDGGKDACQMDSGGPLTLGNTQYGIVSFGVGCARPGWPGVYTNVPEVMPWIRLHTSDDVQT